MIKYVLTCFIIYILFTGCQTNSEIPAMFHKDAYHTGAYQSTNYPFFGDLKWKFKTNGKVFSSPAVMDGIAYIGSEDSNLYAIDITNGQLKWKFLTGGAVHSSPAVYNNTVYFGSFDGFYYAVDAATGNLKWKFKTNGEKHFGLKGLWTMKPADEFMEDPYDFFLSSPAVSGSTVYFGSSNGNVYALNTTTGNLEWQFKTNGVVHTSPAVYNNTVYIGSWDMYLYAIDAKTGKEKWKFKTGYDTSYHLLEGIQASPALYNNMVYLGARDGFFYALNAETGTLAWKYSANNSWVLTTAAIKDSVVYMGTSDTYLFLAFNAQTGKEIFKTKANGYVYSSPALAGNTAYYGDFTGQLFAVDITNGKITDTWLTDGRRKYASEVLKDNNIDFAYLVKGADLALYSNTVVGMNKLYTLGPIISSPSIQDGVIFFGSADGYVYALNLLDKKPGQ